MTISTIIASGLLVVTAGSILLLILSLARPRWVTWYVDRVIAIGFFISLAGMIVSLFYSEVLGYPPCFLCVLQRLFLFPQIAVFGFMLIQKNVTLLFVPLILSSIGATISLYHNYLDWGGTEFVACATDISCTQRFVFEFGFVTIPLMSLFGFIALIAISIIALRKNHYR